MEVVIYSRSGCADSDLMRDHMTARGVRFTEREVDGDFGARQEWEDLDGQVTPLVVIDDRRIVRGMDRARFDQLIGIIGC